MTTTRTATVITLILLFGGAARGAETVIADLTEHSGGWVVRLLAPRPPLQRQLPEHAAELEITSEGGLAIDVGIDFWQDAAVATDSRLLVTPAEPLITANVGAWKTLRVEVRGDEQAWGHPVQIGLILADNDGQEQIYRVGIVDREGWRELSLENAEYIDLVRNREMRRLPLYDEYIPSLRLVGILLTPTGSSPTRIWIRRISLVYDQARIIYE